MAKPCQPSWEIWFCAPAGAPIAMTMRSAALVSPRFTAGTPSSCPAANLEKIAAPDKTSCGTMCGVVAHRGVRLLCGHGCDHLAAWAGAPAGIAESADLRPDRRGSGGGRLPVIAGEPSRRRVAALARSPPPPFLRH